MPRKGGWASLRATAGATTVVPQGGQSAGRGDRRAAAERAIRLARSGILQRPRLKSKAPAWWDMPSEVKEAADRFDQAHRTGTDAAQRAVASLTTGSTDDDRKRRAFANSLKMIQFNRFHVPELADEVPVVQHQTFDPHLHTKQIEWSVWNCDTIWKPRKAWAESLDYHDTEQLYRRALECDWKKCLEDHNTLKIIQRNDDTEGVEDACFEVLWDSVAFVYAAFDYYATFGASDNIFGIQLNAYKLVVETCQLFEAGSKRLNLTAFDQLFIAVNAQHKDEGANALDRQRWLQCLVHFALMRHVLTGAIDSVPEALRYVIMHEMIPRVDEPALYDPHAHRENNCCACTPSIRTSHASFHHRATRLPRVLRSCADCGRRPGRRRHLVPLRGISAQPFQGVRAG